MYNPQKYDFFELKSNSISIITNNHVISSVNNVLRVHITEFGSEKIII